MYMEGLKLWPLIWKSCRVIEADCFLQVVGGGRQWLENESDLLSWDNSYLGSEVMRVVFVWKKAHI